MKNQFFLIFADEGFEARFLFEAKDLNEAISMAYEIEAVNIQGINYEFHVNGVYPIDNKEQIKFCIMQWTPEGLKPFKLANYTERNYIQYFYGHCKHQLHLMFYAGLLTEEDLLSIEIIPLVVENHNKIVHAENGIDIGLCFNDFNVV